jgi:hypothetical protein
MQRHHALLCRRLFLTVCLAGSQLVPASAQEPTASAPIEVPTVLRITTREVVLEVIARDQHHNTVSDLTENEFQVFDVGKHADKNPRRILSVRSIDPHRDDSRLGVADSGFRISTGAICALNATIHYELAVQASPEPGFHQIVVKTTRPKVTLSFRRRYYVGVPYGDEPHTKDRKVNSDGITLGEAACWHSSIPPTLAITAHPVIAPGGGSTRYIVNIRPDSFAEIGLNGPNNRIQLEFGMCTFDANGTLAQYLHSSTDRQLSAEDLARADMKGLSQVLEIPGNEPPYLARLVVRDKGNGNLGIVDVARPVSLAAQSTMALQRPNGSIRSFGVVTPRENTFCGDVYEISSGASVLPDFWNLDPVGSIYTDMLKVYDQDINVTEGIPGATHSNLWFGIDYFGEFYVSKPGEYTFELQSDDGSRLEIDNQPLLDIDGLHPVAVKTARVNLAVGRHTIHVPYFQGTPTRLALVLSVKPPGESMRVFNLTEFAPPKVMP